MLCYVMLYIIYHHIIYHISLPCVCVPFSIELPAIPILGQNPPTQHFFSLLVSMLTHTTEPISILLPSHRIRDKKNSKECDFTVIHYLVNTKMIP
jgi:hypothetical protein